ncbi:PREDICTED: taste receptor type 2 member 4-like [Nanorana parkeri]|uniref:taste receptor type 2 member 4-like n=1 Tax=Nanorana parkeri TaxID=125878 RepID=UPI0008543848|nr:PREDICTED: taste receptor type 2 member 4-like [Nanorana parkeri]
MEGEYHFAWLSLVVAAGIGFVLGLMIHSFIVVVNVMDWLKGRPVPSSERVIASIGISRFVFQSACLFDMFFAIFLNNNYIQFCLNIMKVMSNYSSIWLTTLLSVIFCTKITNFQNAFFLKLKTIVSQKDVHFVAGSVALSIFYGVLHALLNCTAVLTNTTQASSVAGTSNVQIKLKHFIYFLLGNIVPFLIYFTSSFMVIFFLCFHMIKIKTCSTSSISLDNYYTALKSMLCCVLCYAFHVGSNLIAFYFIDSLSDVWINVILNIFPALHSVILIYKTPKLKTRFLRLLLH